MFLKSAFILTLFVALALSCGGGGGRGRITTSRCQPVCRRVCSPIRICDRRGCRVSRPCRRVCTNPCISVKKRAVSDPDGSPVELPAPQRFTYYDTDQDGEISKREFANVLKLTETSVQKSFGIFDINKDGKITPEEFHTMPTYQFDK
jgi:hypothetical protein